MKGSFLLSIALLTAMAASAQKQIIMKTTPQLKKHRQFIYQVIHQNAALNKTTTLHERVIGVADEDFSNGMLGSNDSTTFNYTNGRGSTYDYNEMDYDLQYPYNGNAMFNYNGHNNKPIVLCDTTNLWNITNTPASISEKYISGYDGNNNLTAYKDLFTDSVSQTNVHFVNAFNANNDVIYSLELDANGNGGYDSSLETFYAYDGQNRITEDSAYQFTGTWDLAYKYTYVYDNNGNLAEVDGYTYNGGAWTFVESYVITYTNANQMQTVTFNYDNGGGFQNVYKDSFAYTPGVSFHTYWEEWADINGSGILDSVLFLNYHLNGQNKPDTIYVAGMVNGPVFDSFAIAVGYNNYNDPTKLEYYQYHIGILDDTVQVRTNYYYNVYDDAGVATTNVQQMQVYPNPTTGDINVVLSNATANTTTLRLIGMDGRILTTQTMSGNKTKLNLGNVPSGTYILQMQDNTGKTIGKQTIVKE